MTEGTPDALRPMQVVILAGGLGTRLGEMTRDVPKALVPVAGRPFVDWQLERLREGGADEILFCLGHLGRQVEAHVGAGARFGLDVRYAYDGDVLLGTGGALREAIGALRARFVVTYGDSYLPLRPDALLRAFAATGMPAMMTVLHNQGGTEPSNCEVGEGRVKRYAKGAPTPETTHIDFGMIALQRDEVWRWPSGQKYGMEVVLGGLAARGRLAAFEVSERYYEVGSPQGLAQLGALLAGRGTKR